MRKFATYNFPKSSDQNLFQPELAISSIQKNNRLKQKVILAALYRCTKRMPIPTPRTLLGQELDPELQEPEYELSRYSRKKKLS